VSGDLVTLDDIEAASRRMSGQISRTPFHRSETLSQITRADVWLKFENLQFTGSFKQRGALNTLLQLSPSERARGVIAVSAGNHAQGVAYHAAKLDIPATIVMPNGTPTVKAARTRALGAEVLLTGDDFAQASAAVPRIIEERGLVLIHPFDDDRVIAGQGTVALEMIEEQKAFETLLVAIGGGGLISGMAAAAKALVPGIEVVGVQSDRYPSMAKATGLVETVPGGPSIAEGIAVAVPGQRTLAHVKGLVDDILIVAEDRIETAISLLLQVEKTLAEGAGAAGLAALLAKPDRFRGRRVGLIVCGGNIDNRLLSSILRRQQMREGALFRLAVQLPDRAGALGQLCSEIGSLGGNIDTVQHDRGFLAADAKSARVELEVEVADPALRGRMEQRLQEHGFVLE
jgi:threonine dehydratase